MSDEINKIKIGYPINKRDNYLFLVLDKIAKTKGWDLFFEKGMNKKLSSNFLDLLEKCGYIIINGKNITEEQIIEFNYLNFTNKGKDLYLDIKNSNGWIY